MTPEQVRHQREIEQNMRQIAAKAAYLDLRRVIMHDFSVAAMALGFVSHNHVAHIISGLLAVLLTLSYTLVYAAIRQIEKE